MNWKMALCGGLEPEFGGIGCEFGRFVRLLSLLLKSVTTFYHSVHWWDWCFFSLSSPRPAHV